jgi:Bacterial extracellular solute-binding protein, family 7
VTKCHHRRNHQHLARAIGRRRALASIGAGAISASALSILPLRSARAEAQFTLRLASWGAPTAPQVVNFVAPFQKAVEAGSHGRISVQSFPAGSVVKEQAVPAAIQSRVVDISLTTMGSWASIVPTAGVLNTVFFSPLAADFEKAIGPDTALFKTLDQAMASHGVRLLAVLYNGPVVVVSRTPMDDPRLRPAHGADRSDAGWRSLDDRGCGRLSRVGARHRARRDRRPGRGNRPQGVRGLEIPAGNQWRIRAAHHRLRDESQRVGVAAARPPEGCARRRSQCRRRDDESHDHRLYTRARCDAPARDERDCARAGEAAV